MNVLAYARDALSTGPLCDACLGRPIGDRSFGLGNAERGRALRTTVALEDDEPYEPGEAGECWVCAGVCDSFDTWADRVAEALAGDEFDTYQVGTRVPALLEENERLLREDAGLDAEAGEPLKREVNREVGKRVGARVEADVDFERPDVQVTLDLDTETVDVQINSAFVYGRYRKLERDIPQTEWPCKECNETGVIDGEPCPGCDGTGYRYDESVEELTAPVVRESMDGAEAVFHGAGREDVDALMLGTGRPFVIEVKEPRTRDVDVESLEREINDFADGKAEVEGLRVATHDMVERVKEHDASKTYRMTVAFTEPVGNETLSDALEELEGETIEQRTPNRVAHRRGDIVRTREVYETSGELDDDEASGELEDTTDGERDGTLGDSDDAARATIDIHGEGGLYVKELVSGDEGRTEPSLAGLLGVDAEVTALDVLAVEGEEEPFADETYFRDDGEE
ncbi:tRNA pseudouridine(54/55) synthase Pus10 [Halorhabdus amylolytica]|uniref:tRNA pseudouridine(54/55) synthase Pus10 n=1 Tax=Halorhabdus amylolytica TaxID=2559573 RepID=UPI0010AA7555|nr:tRNA pseudouridine(54/55) synthase Pus10 [Halorhabdus amylolytica]